LVVAFRNTGSWSFAWDVAPATSSESRMRPASSQSASTAPADLIQRALSAAVMYEPSTSICSGTRATM
jgi:hypothetical protein